MIIARMTGREGGEWKTPPKLPLLGPLPALGGQVEPQGLPARAKGPPRSSPARAPPELAGGMAEAATLLVPPVWGEGVPEQARAGAPQKEPPELGRSRPGLPAPPLRSPPRGPPEPGRGGARRARGPVPSPASMAGGGAPCARRLPRPSDPAPLSPPARVSWCRLRGRLIIDRLGSPRLCQQVAPVRPGAGWTRLPPPSPQGGKGAGGVQQGFAGMGAMGGGSRRAIYARAQGPGR